MTKIICRWCGLSLMKEAKFCARCGKIMKPQEGADLHTAETIPLTDKAPEQTITIHAAVTEEIPAIQYDGQDQARSR